MKSALILLVILGLQVFSFAQDKSKNSELPTNNEFVNFENIKGVLKKDGLEKELQRKKEKEKKVSDQKKRYTMNLYSLPNKDDFWKIYIEYWLIKNSTILKWDFQKPDYGLKDYLDEFLRKIGEVGIKYKILYVNTPNITHFAFPFGPNEYLFLISVPFIRTLDLSKQEISLLMLENIVRVKAGHFASFFEDSLINEISNKNFYQKEFPKKGISKLMTKIDEIVLEKGFDFKQQYQTTKVMNQILLSNQSIWQSYYKMIGKIDELVKTNLMYKNYLKIYPSPELQQNWLNPSTK